MTVTVAVLCPSFSRGLQDYTHNLARGLAETDLDFAVYVNRAYPHDTETPMSRPVFSGNPAEDVRRLVTALRKDRPDIVHSQSTNLKLLVLLLVLRPVLGYRLVLTPHSSTSNWDRPLFDRVQYRIYSNCDGVIWHTEHDLEAVDITDVEQTIIDHGNYAFYARDVDLDRVTARDRLGLPERDVVFLFFGYIRSNKRLDLLIDAFASLPPEFRRDASLVVAGKPVADDGSGDWAPFDTYRRRIQEQGIADSVYTWPEFVDDDDVPAFFVASDVIVTPYDTISESGVAHIAFAFGRPVIASRTGGFAELLDDGEHGYLFPSGSVPGLRDRLRTAIKNPDALARMGERNAARARRNDWVSAAEDTVAFYDRVVGPSP